MRIFVFLIFLFFSKSAFCGSVNIYVSPNGNDQSGNGDSNSPYQTVSRAIQDVIDANTTTYNIIVRYISGESVDFHNVGGALANYQWQNKSGTSSGPINIISENEMAIVKVGKVFMNNVEHIKIEGINFECSALDCFQLNKSDNIEFSTNRFDCIDVRTGSGGAIIWVGAIPFNSYEEDEFKSGIETRVDAVSSDDILIVENYFNYKDNIDPNPLDHAIYISNGSRKVNTVGNTITGNTGNLLSFNHGYMEDHTTEKNFFYADNSSDSNLHAVRIGWEHAEEKPFINNILIKYNYLDVKNVYSHAGYCFAEPNLEVTSWYRFKADICEIQGNDYYDRGNYQSNQGSGVAHDPLWLNYSPSQVSKRMVSGDFDGDGKADDFVAIYDAGPSTTEVHVLEGRTSPFKSFFYNGAAGWWNSSGYVATNIYGLASGDFDNDGKDDDLVALYSNGGTSSSLHLWTGATNQFNWHASKWTSSGYDATKVEHRFVSGDFDGDGKKDDLAAFYSNGGSSSDIHVWLGNGTTFIYQGGSGWFSSGGYPLSQVDGRVLASDFNGDGKDDIAAFYRDGSGKTTIHTFLSSGSSFSYQGSSGWWQVTSGYELNYVKNRVVSGDFNSDGLEDLAAFYDNQNGTINIHIWRSTGTSFNYLGASGWFGGAYSVGTIDDRLVSGDFDSDGNIDDILGLSDFGNNSNGHGLRTHVWQGRYNEDGVGNFLRLGENRGLPWISAPYH